MQSPLVNDEDHPYTEDPDWGLTGILISEAYYRYTDTEVVKSLVLDHNGRNPDQWRFNGGDSPSLIDFSIIRKYNPDNSSTEKITTSDGNFRVTTTQPEDPTKGLDFSLNIGNERLSISIKEGKRMELAYEKVQKDVDEAALLQIPRVRILQYTRNPLEFLVIIPYYIQKHYEDSDNKKYLVISIKLDRLPFANPLLLHLDNYTDQECNRISMSLIQFAYILDTYTNSRKSQNRKRKKPPFKY